MEITYKEFIDNIIESSGFEAHRLLAFENPDNYKLVYACTCMAFLKNKNQKRHKITPEEYEEAKLRKKKC